MKSEDLPKDWHLVKLRDAVTKVGSGITPQGGRESYLSEGVPLIRSQNVLDGTLELSNVAYISQSQHRQMKGSTVQPGDVLLNITGASIGRSCVVPAEIGDANVNQHVCIIRTKPLLDPHYLNSVLCSSYGQRLIDSFQAGGGRQGLNFEHIKSFVIPTPPLLTQHHINELSLAWDKAIHLQTQLLKDLRIRQRALAQRLLSGDTRLPGFTGSWSTSKLSEVLVESRELMTSSSQHERIKVKLHLQGVERRSLTREEAEQVTVYYRRHAGQFIYGKQNLQKGALGIIPVELDGFGSSQDIPAFDVTKNFDSDWILHFFSREHYYKSLESLATGTGSKRIQPERLLRQAYKIPALPEQQAIAEVLNTGAAEIRLRQTELTDLREQKRGLMQQLLTGQVLLR